MKKKTPASLSFTEKNRNIRKKVLLLLLSFAVQICIYVALLSLGTLVSPHFYTIGFTVYLSAGAIVLVIYYFLNGATFSSDMPDVRAVDSAYADKLLTNREKAKKLHYILLPMAVLLILVFADMYFGDLIGSLFGE